MRQKILSLVVFGLVNIGFVNIAQANIGYVDGLKLIELSPQGKQELATIAEEFAERTRELKARFERFKAAEAELEKNRLTMSDEEIAKRMAELREMQRKLRRDEREYNEDRTRRRNQGIAKLERVVTEATQSVAKRKKLDLVLQHGVVVYAAEKIHITDDVLAELKKRHKKK